MTGMYRWNKQVHTEQQAQNKQAQNKQAQNRPREKAPETAVLQEKTACIPYRDLL